MNKRIEGIEESVQRFKDEWEASRGCCDVWDFSDEVLYLLATITSLQAERDRYREALQNIIDEYADSDATNMDMAIYFMNTIAQSALKEE